MPFRARASPPFRARTHTLDRPWSSRAVNAMRVPSGEIATGPAASSSINWNSVLSGAGINARTSTAGVDGLGRKKKAAARATSNSTHAAVRAGTARLGARALAGSGGLPAVAIHFISAFTSAALCQRSSGSFAIARWIT